MSRIKHNNSLISNIAYRSPFTIHYSCTLSEVYQHIIYVTYTKYPTSLSFLRETKYNGSVCWSWVVGRGFEVVGRGSQVVGRGSQVVGRGSWVPSRGSRVPSRGSAGRGLWVVVH